MKTYYILLILLLSFSSASAQDTSETSKIESTVMAFDNEGISLNVPHVESVSTVSEDLTSEATLARNSDIKIYLNQVRNVENIDLLFPKINKTVKV